MENLVPFILVALCSFALGCIVTYATLDYIRDKNSNMRREMLREYRDNYENAKQAIEDAQAILDRIDERIEEEERLLNEINENRERLSENYEKIIAARKDQVEYGKWDLTSLNKNNIRYIGNELELKETDYNGILREIMVKGDNEDVGYDTTCGDDCDDDGDDLDDDGAEYPHKYPVMDIYGEEVLFEDRYDTDGDVEFDAQRQFAVLDWHIYWLRGRDDDPEIPGSVERVRPDVNRLGKILSKNALISGLSGWSELEPEDYGYLGEEMTVEEYFNGVSEEENEDEEEEDGGAE